MPPGESDSSSVRSVDVDAAYKRGEVALKSIVHSADRLSAAWFEMLDELYDRVVRGDVSAIQELSILVRPMEIFAAKINERTTVVLGQKRFPGTVQ